MLNPRIISFDADHNDDRGDGAALEAISRKDNMVVVGPAFPYRRMTKEETQ